MSANKANKTKTRKDKNKAVKDWLLKCPEIQADRLYFNFLKAEEGSQGFITNSQDGAVRDIVGNKSGVYDFSIIDFRAMSNSPVACADEDLNSMVTPQQILDWVKITDERPDFGEGVIIDEIYPFTDSPDFAGIEQLETYNLAKYMIAVRIEYFERND